MKNNLKELRARFKMTQDDLAGKVEVSRQTIIAIENERYDPSLPLAFKLAKVFRLKIEEIFSLE
ncbi:Helix-turn-helix [Candidatus Gugararchaeum adminiculabundum]|nr:Helix-turn-helix [Candidatus Gugararchaeum adminiculabundum]